MSLHTPNPAFAGLNILLPNLSEVGAMVYISDFFGFYP
jgi:hypothetical protein